MVSELRLPSLVRLQMGELGGGRREAVKSVRSLWEIQTLGTWAWSFLEMQESAPCGLPPSCPLPRDANWTSYLTRMASRPSSVKWGQKSALPHRVS